MKQIILFGIMIVFVSCSSTQLVDNWKNPEIDSYRPSKVLIVGMTPDQKARRKFERSLKKELELREVEAIMSMDYLDYVSATEEQLKTLEYKLLNEGFDTILFTKTIGVEDRIMYKENFNSNQETYTRFQDDYLRYQDIFYNPEYYHEYSVYNAVTSMYCICPTKDRELIWKGYIDIIDPQDIDASIKDYVRLVIVVLEEQDLLEVMPIEID